MSSLIVPSVPYFPNISISKKKYFPNISVHNTKAGDVGLLPSASFLVAFEPSWAVRFGGKPSKYTHGLLVIFVGPIQPRAPDAPHTDLRR